MEGQALSSTLDKDEQTLATERYEPALSGHYNDLFHALVIRMGNTLPSNRAEMIKTEMARVSEEENQNDVEALRYIIVSLNPYVKAIKIIQDTQFAKQFSSCYENGMSISAYSCRLKNASVFIEREIPIFIE